MKDREAGGKRWLRQAENDLEPTRLALREGFHSQACYNSYQVAEKALKAVAYFRGDRLVLTNSVMDLVSELDQTYSGVSAHQRTAGVLDQYYVATRYPDAQPGGVPYEKYDRHQAQEAVDGAAAMVEFAASIIQTETAG